MQASLPLSFDLIGPAAPVSPVVISIPHAGRDYPPGLIAALKASRHAIQALEDRHVDALGLAARGDETMIVARRARAWIDLNRAEHERDPLIDEGAQPTATPHASAKVRGGLGLVPRRVGGVDIWRRRWRGDEVAARIAGDHRPYHATLARLLATARARFGVAVLLDLHSMPPIAGRSAPRVVIGDRFGRASASRFVARIEAVVRGARLPLATNAPYPGGHILERHGDPLRGVHAIQLEIDRALYLDADLESPGPGFDAMAGVVREVIAALADEALPIAQAAE